MALFDEGMLVELGTPEIFNTAPLVTILTPYNKLARLSERRVRQ